MLLAMLSIKPWRSFALRACTLQRCAAARQIINCAQFPEVDKDFLLSYDLVTAPNFVGTKVRMPAGRGPCIGTRHASWRGEPMQPQVSAALEYIALVRQKPTCKTVCFSKSPCTLRALASHLGSHSCRVICGDSSAEERKSALNDFRSVPAVDVLLMSVETGAELSMTGSIDVNVLTRRYAVQVRSGSL